MIYLFSFIIGIILGSFFNVVSDRIVKDESFITGRSHCEYCKHTLSTLDLIPLISYLMLKGKCRYCKKKLSIYYPFSELITGIVFALSGYFFIQFLNVENVISVLFYLVTISSLLIIFLTDIKYYIIPDKILYPIMVLTIVYIALVHANLLLISVITGILCFLLFLLIFVVTKRKGIGFGDVKYAFWLGILLSFPSAIVALYIAFIVGAIVSVLLIVGKRKKLHGDIIPFGPFLVLGTYVALFWGPMIWQYILHLSFAYL